MRIIEAIIIIFFFLDIILCIRDCRMYIKYRYSLNYPFTFKRCTTVLMSVIMYVFFPYIYYMEDYKLPKDINIPPKKFELEINIEEENKKNKYIRKRYKRKF